MFLVPRESPVFDDDLESLAALKDYIHRLESYDLASICAPLVPGYTFSFEASVPGLPYTRQHRALPPALRAGGPLHLRLIRTLISTAKSDTQISNSGMWLAQVVLPDAEDEAEPTTGSVDVLLVAVKILQPSQMHFPAATTDHCSDRELLSDWQDYESPDWLARNEAAGYDRLNKLQGTTLPYFFGKAIVSFLLIEPL